jgi:hypothetical protein
MVHVVHIERGNTSLSPPKRVSPSAYWGFTLNNWTQAEVDELISKVVHDNRWYCMGSEIGEQGTPHIQGYIEGQHKDDKFRPLPRYSVIREGKNACSFAKKTNSRKRSAKQIRMDNYNYCIKDKGEAHFKFFSNIKAPRKCKILSENMLYDWQKDIIEHIILVEPDDRTIYWFYDEECNAGKTTFCKYLVKKYGAQMLGGKSADMKNGIIDYINKEGEAPEIILVNLPKTFDQSYLSYTGLEESKDMCFYSGKYEGGMVCENCPHLIVFSNELPKKHKCDPKRWVIRNLRNYDSVAGTNKN